MKGLFGARHRVGNLAQTVERGRRGRPLSRLGRWFDPTGSHEAAPAALSGGDLVSIPSDHSGKKRVRKRTGILSKIRATRDANATRSDLALAA